jgi:hypothetical protein
MFEVKVVQERLPEPIHLAGRGTGVGDQCQIGLGSRSPGSVICDAVR